jgi:hypothetical protein
VQYTILPFGTDFDAVKAPSFAFVSPLFTFVSPLLTFVSPLFTPRPN